MERQIIDAAVPHIDELAKILVDYAAAYRATHICAAHEAAKPLADACAALGAKTLFRRDAPAVRGAVAPYEGCLPDEIDAYGNTLRPDAVLVIGLAQSAIDMVDVELRAAYRSVVACGLVSVEEGLAHMQIRRVIRDTAQKIELTDLPR